MAAKRDPRPGSSADRSGPISAPPVDKRPPPSKQATVFGGNVGIFVPSALVPSPPIRNPDPNKAGARPKFKVTQTPQQARVTREAKAGLAQDKRVVAAQLAPVSTDAKVRLRASETATERRARTGTVPTPVPASRRVARRRDPTGDNPLGKGSSIFADAGAFLGSAGVGLGKLAAGALIETAYEAQSKRGRESLVPAEATAAIAGAKAALTPAVYLTTGPDLMNAIVGLDHSRAGLAFDLAFLPLGAVGRPIKGARAVGAVAKAVAKGKRGEEILDIADEVYRGRSVLQARKLKQAEAAVTVAKIRSAQLSPAHGRALAGHAEIERQVSEAAVALKIAKPEARPALEKGLEQLKGQRSAAKQEVLYQKLRAIADWDSPGVDDPLFAARDAVSRDLIKRYKGRRGALPEKATVRQLNELINFLDEMTENGEAGKLWYETSAAAIKEMAGDDLVKAERFAQLLAIYSPQQGIIGNTSLAIRAWNEFQMVVGEAAQGEIRTGQEWQREAATRVLSGEADWDGRKTNNFYVNFLEDIDAAKFQQLVDEGAIRPDGVTIDMWMARVFGYRTDMASDGRYDVMESIVRQIAAERGWKPKQVQAAIWTAIKEASDDSAANVDFSSGIARYYGQFNFEAAPSISSGFADTYRGWPEEMQQQFMEANGRLVDEFLTDVGFLSEPSRLGAGVYAGPDGVQFNPAASARFLASAHPRHPGRPSYRLHETERLQIERAAAAIGRALEQDSVAWVRPSVALSPGHADTIHVSLDRVGTSEEAQTLYRALNGEAGEDFAVINAADGFIIRNFSDTIPNLARGRSAPSLRTLTAAAAEATFPATDVRLTPFAADGDLVQSGDYGRYLERGDGAGAGDDLRFQTAADQLAGDATELRARFVTAGDRDGAGAARAGVDPDARVAELEAFLKPHIDNAYRYLRDSNPTSTIRRDKRPRRVATSADKFKTHAIGVGDPVERDLPLILPRDGTKVDLAKAEEIIYEAAIRSDGPMARRIVEAFEEIDQISSGQLAEAEARFMAATTPLEEARTQAAANWVERLKDAVQAESAALGLLPLAGVDDTLQLGAAATASTVALAGARAGVKRSLARGLDVDYVPRTLMAGGLEVQIPKARSLITGVGERLVDSASRALDTPGIRNTPGIRIVTATERAVKYAGRSQKQEAPRALALVAKELKTISKVDEGSAEDVAHFWYAQLPEAYRNADGLRLIEGKQVEELEHLTSGAALAELDQRALAVKAGLAEAETGSQAGHFMRELDEIKLERSDIRLRIEDTSASITKLRELAEIAPPVNQPLLDSLERLAADRTRILVASGRLKAERASGRQSLLATWLGVEPDGSEIYMGHRSAKPESMGGPSGRISGGAGRVSSPQGTGTENRLILAANGRLRPSTRVAAEDWQSAQVFEQMNVARDDLGKMGSPFTGRVPPDHVLVNPKGQTIPLWWKTDELAQFSEDAEDISDLRMKAKELVDQFVATDRNGYEEMIEAALANGINQNELRVVPKRLLDRYYSQFRSFKGRSTPLVAYDMAVDAAATSIIFLRAGYVPKNVVQNLIISVPHQGVMLPVNAARAAQALADPELRALLKAEVGFTGASGALAKEAASKQVLGKVAGFVGALADDPARIAAFMHEAAAEGVISRFNPLLTGKDRRKLIELLTQKRHRARLNDIRSRTVESMADFSRMTPDQAKMARRFLIIPGWLMAGSRYPFHFAATHPIRSALIAYIAMGEPGAPEELRFNEPITHYFNGTRYLEGIDTPWGRLRTNSLNPVTTPWDLALSVKGSIEGKSNPFDYDTPTAFDWANPFASALIGVASGEGVSRSLKPLLPNLGFVQGMISPEESPRYPEDRTRWGRFKREIGILPIEVNDELNTSSAAADDDGRPGGVNSDPRPDRATADKRP